MKRFHYLLATLAAYALANQHGFLTASALTSPTCSEACRTTPSSSRSLNNGCASHFDSVSQPLVLRADSQPMNLVTVACQCLTSMLYDAPEDQDPLLSTRPRSWPSQHAHGNMSPPFSPRGVVAPAALDLVNWGPAHFDLTSCSRCTCVMLVELCFLAGSLPLGDHSPTAEQTFRVIDLTPSCSRCSCVMLVELCPPAGSLPLGDHSPTAEPTFRVTSLDLLTCSCSPSAEPDVERVSVTLANITPSTSVVMLPQGALDVTSLDFLTCSRSPSAETDVERVSVTPASIAPSTSVVILWLRGALDSLNLELPVLLAPPLSPPSWPSPPIRAAILLPPPPSPPVCAPPPLPPLSPPMYVAPLMPPPSWPSPPIRAAPLLPPSPRRRLCVPHLRGHHRRRLYVRYLCRRRRRGHRRLHGRHFCCHRRCHRRRMTVLHICCCHRRCQCSLYEQHCYRHLCILQRYCRCHCLRRRHRYC